MIRVKYGQGEAAHKSIWYVGKHISEIPGVKIKKKKEKKISKNAYINMFIFIIYHNGLKKL